MSPYSSFPWLQPYPDQLLDDNPANDPDAVVIAKETIELAYMAAIQVLSHKQRAVLILRDVLDFSAAETASVLDDTVVAVNSALQRARAALQRTDQPAKGRAHRATHADEAELLARYMAAHEQMNPGAVIEVLRDDARLTINPMGMCWDGRDDITPSFMEGMGALGEFRCVASRANRQPAVANYLRRWGDTEYRAFTIVILGIVDDQIIDMATFANPDLFTAFGLPATTT